VWHFVTLPAHCPRQRPILLALLIIIRRNFAGSVTFCDIASSLIEPGGKPVGSARRLSLSTGCPGRAEPTNWRYSDFTTNRTVRYERNERGIENSCRWVLDVTYREDESRIREEALGENFAWINAMKRRSCGWNENFLLEVVSGMGSK